MSDTNQTHNSGLVERCFARFGQHYILVMMLATRLFGSIGGLLVIYYIELALKLPDSIRIHFRAAALVVTVFACSLMVLLACSLPLSGCLYSFRAGTGFPAHIRTLAVLPFENETTRFELTQELHQVLLQELPRSLGIRPSSEEVADAVVRGTIANYTTSSPLYRSAQAGGAAEVAVRQVSVMIRVEIVDLVDNVILWDSQSLSGRGDFLEAQIEDVGRVEAIEQLVQQIVDGAQSNW